jgi:hypothetical protein
VIGVKLVLQQVHHKHHQHVLLQIKRLLLQLFLQLSHHLLFKRLLLALHSLA